jgi:hypothetical protein
MKTNILNRLIGNFEKDITWLGKQRIKECFEPYKTISVKNSDSKETRELILKYNTGVKEFNRCGETLALLWIYKMDQFQTRPQDDRGPDHGILGVLDEWLRLRALKRDKSLFRSVHSQMHILDRKMFSLSKGRDGIEDLQKRIKKSRKV